MVKLVDTEYTFNAGKKAGINTLESRVGAGTLSGGCMHGNMGSALRAELPAPQCTPLVSPATFRRHVTVSFGT